jgi:hypothetical protein
MSSTLQIVLLAVAIVFGLLYMFRRRSRLRKED